MYLGECETYSTALDITDVANQLAAESYPVNTDDLATIVNVRSRQHG